MKKKINSRAKGARTELELAKKLQELFGWKARRTVQFCGKLGDADVLIPEIPQVLVESKAVEKLNIHAVMERAAEDAKAKGKLPVVMHKKNRTGWLVTVRLEDLPVFSAMIEASKCMREAANENGSEQGMI